MKLPTPEQLRGVAADLGMTFTSEDLASHLEAMRPGIDLYNILDRLPDELPAVNIRARRAGGLYPKRTRTTPGM